MAKASICVVTGSRAEYGLLYGVMREVEADPELDLQVVATGMHLSPEFGLTVQSIQADGFEMTEQIEMLVSSDTPVGMTKSIGLGVIGFADALQRLRPDIVIVLGDRFEIFAAALAAYIARIPIAHIGGGDVTEGALDEAIRHSITKMASLHFVTNEASRRRVCQLGEDPARVFNVGHPGIDRIVRLTLLSRDELERALGFRFLSRNLLVTFHPVTLGNRDSTAEFAELLDALDQLGEKTGILFTKPNADPHGRRLAEMVDEFVRDHPNAKAYSSLGQQYYFSVVKWVDAVVGNSSSGICEVPALGKPTVDIGDRQKGRLRGNSVIHCEARREAILRAIEAAYQFDGSNVENPYGDGTSSQKIVQELRRHLQSGQSQPKHFYEVGS
ncbi:UDP-N-acetylglucosamine 2-epimerase [Alicyclobacillus macrosporangiidus]|uniref:UDP-N-acetylglucosamine 2-epimerase n=1 Tax=Alicyclobacillus macrosporangiidus TaxID=392015 RepID=UPI000495935D|nr:UDP-N-acetylglucosamine 2-epimerase [Alicyclobacillus macrosporangiidus]